MTAHIDIPQDELAAFCRRNRIRRLALFGSVLRDDFGPNSDVDVLVEFEPGARVGFFELYDLEQDLARLTGNREVEISTVNSLSDYFREDVLREAEDLYVQA